MPQVKNFLEKNSHDLQEENLPFNPRGKLALVEVSNSEFRHVTEHYALLNVTGLYTSNKLNAARFQVSAMLAKLGSAVDRDAWDMVLRVNVCACHFLMLSPPNESHM